MTPIVSVIIATHLDSIRPYMEVCVKSFLTSVGVDFEILLISDAETNPKEFIPYNERLRTFHDKELDSFMKKANFGIKNMSPSSKCFLLVNDDTLINKYALSSMVESALSMNCVINPLCTADNTAMYYANMDFRTPTGEMVQLKTHMNLEDIKGCEDNLINMIPPIQNKILFFQDWVPFHATCIPKKIWEEVGELDPGLYLYGNDWDWCIRAAQKGYRCAVDLSSFLIHFQHKTLDTLEQLPETKLEFKKQQEYFMEKRKKSLQNRA